MTMPRLVIPLLLLVALAVPAAARAQDDVPGGIGLVLGGGGARGAAHIGVLKVLERERIPVHYVAGTSMGAMVGGLYAAGYSPEEIEGVVSQLDWKELLSDAPSRESIPMRRKEEDLRFLLDLNLGVRDRSIQFPRGLLQGQKLLLLLRRLLLPVWRIEDFDDLAIPFRCVATDIGTGKPVVFDSGDLALAVRASLSVPGVLSPLNVEGTLLVDGGLVEQVPIGVARAMGADRIIAIDLTEPLLPESELSSPVQVTLQMITIMMKQRTAEQLQALGEGDLLIVPTLEGMASSDFANMAEAVALGERAAQAQVEQLRRYAVDEATYADWKARHRRRDFDAPLVEFLDVVTRESGTAGYVQNQLERRVGEPLRIDALREDIDRAFGLGTYERIDWRLVEHEGRTGLRVTPVDKSWGPTFLAFGLAFSDDFNGDSSYLLTAESTTTGINRYGGEWRNRITLGQRTGFRTEFFQPFGGVGQYFAQPWFEYVALQQPLGEPGALLAEFRISRREVGLEFGYDPVPTLRLSAALLRGRDHAALTIGDPEAFPEGLATDYAAARVSVLRDTLDNAEFPSGGSRFQLDLVDYGELLGGESDGQVVDLVWDKALARGNSRLLLGTRLHTSWGEVALIQEGGVLGGFTNLSGFGERALFGPHAALLRGVYYQRFGDAESLFSVPVYVGASLEAGNVWAERDQVSLESLIFAGSLFVGVDTAFGPIFLGYGHAETGDSSWYLNFGSLLRPRL
ncbi:MAG TPA: patatin-like phospholipase family protein [Xanthomonadaceae bacterium]|nr:patatin-like phospholipase family protein [Xanthomonadaceae bacterium]